MHIYYLGLCTWNVQSLHPVGLGLSVTRLGYFWKNTFFQKIFQIFGNFLRYFEKDHIWHKNCFDYFRNITNFLFQHLVTLFGFFCLFLLVFWSHCSDVNFSIFLFVSPYVLCKHFVCPKPHDESFWNWLQGIFSRLPHTFCCDWYRNVNDVAL